MKTKKIIVLTMVAVLALVSFVPSTFSWYTHNASLEGNKINYSDNLPVSIKSAANTISMTTYESDANGVATSNIVSGGISIAADETTKKAVKYYKTVFTNTGNNDVMVDFETTNMPNDADFYIGTFSPTLNEKAYASRPVRTKISDTTVRVYFKTHSQMTSYWGKDSGRLKVETDKYDSNGTKAGAGWEAGSTNQKNDNNGTNNDINLSYKVGDKEYQVKMAKCANTESGDTITNTTNVYYYDIPSNTEKFFFFNHWYLRSASNREWNRTIDITDLTAGRLYYLTNGVVDGQYKEYAVRDVNKNLVALNQYYTNVRMSKGSNVYADISLKKDSEDESFIPDYYGQSISYNVISNTPVTENTTVATINRDGLITPLNYGSATIRTTITGVFGDTKTVDTTVDIPQSISQLPIIKNIRVPAQGATNSEGKAANKVEVDWYAINKSATETMTTGSLYFTI